MRCGPPPKTEFKIETVLWLCFTLTKASEDTQKKKLTLIKKTNVFQEEDRCAVSIMELIAKTRVGTP